MLFGNSAGNLDREIDAILFRDILHGTPYEAFQVHGNSIRCFCGNQL